MNRCLACGSEKIQTKSVQLLRADLRINKRQEFKELREIACKACGYSHSIDELQTHPSSNKTFATAL